jgi:hypothetical protein
MSNHGKSDLKEAAEKAVGNWRRFESFAWFRAKELDDPDSWAVFYTHHRDSTLIDESNAAFIAKALNGFQEGDDPDVLAESHDHWAVGWIDGFAIRIFHHGKITDAFHTYHQLTTRLEDYPLLDEHDYSRREFEATLANLPNAAWRLRREFELPEDWQSDVYDWLSDHEPAAIENRDDRGGYPTEAQLRHAFTDLGYKRAA